MEIIIDGKTIHTDFTAPKLPTTSRKYTQKSPFDKTFDPKSDITHTHAYRIKPSALLKQSWLSQKMKRQLKRACAVFLLVTGTAISIFSYSSQLGYQPVEVPKQQAINFDQLACSTYRMAPTVQPTIAEISNSKSVFFSGSSKQSVTYVPANVQPLKSTQPEAKPAVAIQEVQDFQEVAAVITFYTDLPSENGGYDVTYQGHPHKSTTIAAPKDVPIGTEIDCGDLGRRVVDDRGSAIIYDKEGRMKLDVYIPRNKGENDYTYKKRVNDMGIKHTTVKVKTTN